MSDALAVTDVCLDFVKISNKEEEEDPVVKQLGVECLKKFGKKDIILKTLHKQPEDVRIQNEVGRTVILVVAFSTSLTLRV